MGVSLKVVRCVCAEVSFATVKESGASTMEEAEAWFGCGLSCGLCRPYLERMLETGETEFEPFPVPVEND